MSRIRSDLWCSALVRRHNDAGNMCVIARKGDAIAGQIWIEFDHLNGTSSLLTPAPSSSALDLDSSDLVFQLRFDAVPHQQVADRIARESEFDPDFWHVVVESRHLDDRLNILKD